jgi:hypothetical protein
MIKNLFRFQRIKQNESLSINCTIDDVTINGYNFALDESLVNPLVFEKVNTITVMNSVGSIQVGLFKS